MNFSSFFNYPDQEEVVEQPQLTLLADWSAKLLGHMQTQRFSRGDLVVGQGQTDRALYLLAGGDYQLTLGRRKIVLSEVGTVLDEQTFLDGQPRAADVRALSEGEVYRLSFDSFELFTAHEPDLARDLLLDLARIVSLRLRETNQWLVASGG